MSKFTATAFSYLAAAAACFAQSYTISTTAGGVNPYYYPGTGDGGPATAAGLANPCFDVAVDRSGNVYVIAGKLIRKFAPGGNISTYAGGGSDADDYVPGVQAAIEPTALAIDSTGNLFFADTAYGVYRIRKIDSKGVVTTVAGGGQCCTLGDGGPALSAYIAIPYGLAIDAAGNLYFAQANAQFNLVRKIAAADGSITTIAAAGSLSRPTGVAVDGSGNLFIAEAGGNRIRKVAPDGTLTTIAGAPGVAINTPWHVAVDAGGTVYFTENGGARIRAISSSGSVTTIAGTGTVGSDDAGGSALKATLDHPAGIAISPAGTIYFTQNGSGFARVRALVPLIPAPAIATSGVVPVYSSAGTIQAGSWISIYGTNLASGSATWNGDFPTQLGNTSVTIDSKPAYLWFVSPNQINAQVPDDSLTGPVTVTVTTVAGSGSSTVTLGAYAPSFSMFNSKYPAAIAIVNGPGNSGSGYDYIGPAGAFAFPSRPVKPGETLILFGVGFGATKPPVPAGKAFNGSAPSVDQPIITIGGVRANVSFSGIVQAGLFQFNVIVPAAASGDQPLQAVMAGVTTPDKISIAVQ